MSAILAITAGGTWARRGTLAILAASSFSFSDAFAPPGKAFRFFFAGCTDGPTGWAWRMGLLDGPGGWVYRMGLPDAGCEAQGAGLWQQVSRLI